MARQKADFFLVQINFNRNRWIPPVIRYEEPEVPKKAPQPGRVILESTKNCSLGVILGDLGRRGYHLTAATYFFKPNEKGGGKYVANFSFTPAGKEDEKLRVAFIELTRDASYSVMGYKNPRDGGYFIALCANARQGYFDEDGNLIEERVAKGSDEKTPRRPDFEVRAKKNGSIYMKASSWQPRRCYRFARLATFSEKRRQKAEKSRQRVSKVKNTLGGDSWDQQILAWRKQAEV